VEIGGEVTLGHEPKTKRSQRAVPVARAVMRRSEEHLAAHVGPDLGALVFTASQGGPLFRSTFARDVWRPAVRRAGLEGITFPRSAAQLCGDPGGGWMQRPRGVGMGRTQQRSFHPDSVGGLFEAGSAEAVDRLDALLGGR
jgi:hypothetical protein